LIVAEVPYGEGVPTVAPDTRVPDDFQHVQATPASFGGLIAKGVEQAGAGLTDTSKNLFDIAQLHDKTTTDDQVNHLMTTSRILRYGDPDKTVTGPDGRQQPDTGYLGTRSRTALDDRKGTMEALDAAIADGRRNLPSVRAQLDYDNQTRRMRAIWADEIGRHYNTQYNVWTQEVNSTGAAHSLDGYVNSLDAAASNENQDAVASKASNARDFIEFRVRNAQLKSGNDPQVVAQAQADAKRELLKAEIFHTAAKDPAAAQRILENGSKIAGTEYPELDAHVRARADQQDGIDYTNEKLGLKQNADTLNFYRSRTGARIEGTSPVFANRLRSALEAAEAATGQQARIDSLKRSTAEQARLYQRYITGQGGLAAPPGQSRHEFGEAADIPDGKVLDWLHQHASEYGLEFLKGKAFENDSGHIQLARGAGAPAGGTATGGIAVGGTSPLPPKGDIMMQILSDPKMQQRPGMQAAALAQVNHIYEAQHVENVQGEAIFKRREQDAKSEALDTGQVTNPITEDDFVTHYGPERGREAFEDYSDTVQLGANMKALGTMSPEEVSKTFQDTQPQPGVPGYARAAKNSDLLARAYEQIQKDRREDAGGVAVREMPAVRAAWQTFEDAASGKSHLPPATAAANFAEVTLAEQARVGVPPDQRRILPKAIAQDMATRWRAPGNQPPGKEAEGGAVAVLSQIQNSAKVWGDRWPEVYREVAPKLDPVLRVIAAGVDPAAGTKLLNAQNIPIGKILASEDEVKDTDLKRDVIDALKPFARTVAGSQRDQTVSDYTMVAHKLAAIYARDGMTSTAAAAQAAKELVLGKYDFVDSGDSHYRVPKLDDDGRPLPYTSQDISAGAAAAKKKLGTTEMPVAPKRDDVGGLSPEYLANETAGGLRRNGIWVTSPKEDGLALLQGNGFAARRPDGSPVVLSWKELAALGRANPRRDNYDIVGFPR
jgi:hypothetical protein